MVSLTQILIGFFLSVIASVISAFVTVGLSLNQFRSQQPGESGTSGRSFTHADANNQIVVP